MAITPFTKHALASILAALARFAVRHQLALQMLVEQLKVALVRAAEAELVRSGDEPNASRISVISGVHRSDVSRIQSSGAPENQSIDLITRVIGAWQHRKPFCSSAGKPKPLTFEGANSEFAKLVMVESREISPYTVLRELERTGLVVYEENKVILVQFEYIPRGDVEASAQVLERDLHDLILTVERNVLSTNTGPALHLRTEFNNIALEKMDAVRQWLLAEGAQFQERARAFIAQHDADINPKYQRDVCGGRVALTTISIADAPTVQKVTRTRKRGRKKRNDG